MRKISGGFGAVVRVAALMGMLLAAAAAAPAHDSSVARANPGKVRASAAGLSSLPVAAQGSISARLGRDLPAYRIRSVSGGFEGQNPKKTLRSDFTSQGVTVHGAGAAWGMTLRGYGHGDDLNAGQETAPRASANRVEYRHGPMTEWYVNGPLGLEQGFTFDAPPTGTGAPWPADDVRDEHLQPVILSAAKDLLGIFSTENSRCFVPLSMTKAGCAEDRNDSPLTLALSLSGDVAASADDAGKGLTLSVNGHPALRYTGLAAYDADGKELRAWMETQGDRLLLKADDAGARYPVRIDPLVQLAELTASDGTANDYLASSVAINGDTVVVGAPGHNGQGAAYVFVKPASGWSNMTRNCGADSFRRSQWRRLRRGCRNQR